MKITEIRIDRTKNLGSYENIKLGFTIAVSEDSDPVVAIENAKTLMDWEINKDERSKRYAELKTLLDSGQASGTSEGARAWIAKYEAMKDQVENAWK